MVSPCLTRVILRELSREHASHLELTSWLIVEQKIPSNIYHCYLTYMKTQLSLHHELADLIQQMKTELQKDIVDPTSIPAVYQDILHNIHLAEQQLQQGNIDAVIDIIGEINLDLLDQVDEFDATLMKIATQLKAIRAFHKERKLPLPLEITNALQQLSTIVEKYTII